jgi:hypothetical protein
MERAYGTTPRACNARRSCRLLEVEGIKRDWQMPKYYFSIQHGDQIFEDSHGLDLPDSEDAWRHATKMCGKAIQKLDGKLRPDHEWRLDVETAERQPLFSLRVVAEHYD